MSDTLHILGDKPLQGSVVVGGSKNGTLPMLAACLLVEGECRLQNIPRIEDVETMLALLRRCGAKVERSPNNEVVICASELSAAEVPADLAGKMRASYYLLGPLAGRLGRACLPLPGGCDLGSRPVDYILRPLESLGLTAEIRDERLLLNGSPTRGGRVELDSRYRSPGATFTTIMAACLGDGETVIENACGEPDIVSFCEFLNLAGAKIQGAGSSTIRIQGVKRLRGVEHQVLGDRLEAGTFLLAGAASRGDVTVLGVSREHLTGFVEALEECGVEVRDEPGGIRALCPKRPRAIEIITHPFPGFPTDLQPPMMALLACAEGESRVEESIFDGRMGHVEELRRMGASIEVKMRKAVIHGVPLLKGAEVEALNIRAGGALVVAAVGAEDETILRGLSHLARGYERIEEKLSDLGAQVQADGPAS
ncbi:MAG: UDP-N-acetylglucosamine 1-carboxyvinyltransferase [Armatimonadetes bacterium]|nr:UDP-N-acetylglucosamine 1-carboxyvinyltransferase [Armatimonadota bacterium]NIM24075.1 UDP-N-acetylglucosamine 1-carboxyvinyltransferase [Armatimonadota bacterium]NIM67929.1 UDP-N-acetylglucosamine 1-carboxyvinyltransferase [Armatimonadota bacterium]NIM76451.1 UDP-N-acetylglucosamine 1-carboxyvinyltransferase [Armatimonadota bacterium]NIN06159.1 UDP-N-acetylglucosamine 1-carboxyvinyltransferase [Armatimonadota bacterium]